MSHHFATRISKLKAYSETQVSIFLMIMRKYCLLDEGVGNKLVTAKYDNSYGAHGFNSIAYQLSLSIIKDCYELALGKQKGAPSTRYLVDALCEEDVRQYFCDSFSQPLKQHWIGLSPPLDYQKRIAEAQREKRTQIFEDAFKRFLDSYNAVETSSLFKKAKDVRNKVVSHFEVKMKDDVHILTDIELFGFKWDDVDQLVKNVEPLVFDAYLLINNASYASDRWTNEKTIAKDFWSRTVS